VSTQRVDRAAEPRDERVPGADGGEGLLARLELSSLMTVMRERGLRVSAARRLVLEALLAADGPMSAEQIAEGIGGRVPASDIASVYRNLQAFYEIGLVRPVHLGHGPGLHALAIAGEREYLTCERCADPRGARRGARDGRVPFRLLRELHPFSDRRPVSRLRRGDADGGKTVNAFTDGAGRRTRRRRMAAALTAEEWRRIGAMVAVVVGLHGVGFFILFALVAPHQYALGLSGAFTVGLGLTAYTLGLRHAFDADHIAAIDNTTRKLMSDGKQRSAPPGMTPAGATRMCSSVRSMGVPRTRPCSTGSGRAATRSGSKAATVPATSSSAARRSRSSTGPATARSCRYAQADDLSRQAALEREGTNACLTTPPSIRRLRRAGDGIPPGGCRRTGRATCTDAQAQQRHEPRRVAIRRRPRSPAMRAIEWAVTTPEL
jgi:hypothetical protein